jgi:hypothetical protein
VEQELEQLLDECPDTPRENMENHELLDELALVEQKIDRLISALAESSDLSMPYINRTIERLEQERQGLLRQQGKQHQCLRSNMGHLRFSALTFAQKKLVATQFIKEIKLADSNAEVIWNV